VLGSPLVPSHPTTLGPELPTENDCSHLILAPPTAAGGKGLKHLKRKCIVAPDASLDSCSPPVGQQMAPSFPECWKALLASELSGSRESSKESCDPCVRGQERGFIVIGIHRAAPSLSLSSSLAAASLPGMILKDRTPESPEF
jgi:hypothetical protein